MTMEDGLFDAMLDVLTEEHAVDPTQVRQEALRLYLIESASRAEARRRRGPVAEGTGLVSQSR